MDEGFTATAYLNVQENLKLTVEENVILEEPASSTGTLSSLQHLAKDFSFGDQFFNDKPSEAENVISVQIKESRYTSAARRMKKRRHDSPKTPLGSPPRHRPLPPPPEGPSRTSRSFGESRSSQVPPPPHLPPSTNQEGQSHGSIASSSSKTAASAEYTAWTTSDTRFKPSLSSIPEDLHMDDDLASNEQIHLSDNEDIKND
nr:hypothetical protein [Tanacetum cinerariifolium]